MVLDSIRAVCEAINNDALAATKEQPVMQGIENPAATLGSGKNQYTTIPLRPLTGDCNFLLNNYIHHRIPFAITLKAYDTKVEGGKVVVNTASAASFASDIDYAIYFLSSALMPKRFQLMIGNTVIYQNTFQRTEATVTINSLPPDVVEKSDDITTMSKLLERKTIPGQYFTWKGNNYKITSDAVVKDTDGPTTQTCNFIIDTTIDLQRFSPIISNLAFIPIEYGDLKLRLFYDNLDDALNITVLPSQRNGYFYGKLGDDDAHTTSIISHNNLNVVERRPLKDGFMFIEPTLNASCEKTSDHTFKHSTFGGVQKAIVCDTVAWGMSSSGDNATIVEIVQSTFRLREESKILLKNYIMQDNRLIIPTHTWSTALALNPPSQTSGQMMWNFSAYNIDMLAFTFPINQQHEDYLPNPIFDAFDVKLNSKSVNFVPYEGTYSARFIKDTKQAFLNTDEYATNENLTYSLKPYTSIINGEINDNTKFVNAVYEAYRNNSNNIEFKPNTFCYAINLTPPNSFEKGMCVASSNPQAMQLRITYNKYASAPSATMLADTSINQCYSDIYNFGNGAGSTPAPFALALQGCCLVLIYNPIVGACQAGEVVFVEPFVN